MIHSKVWAIILFPWLVICWCGSALTGKLMEKLRSIQRCSKPACHWISFGRGPIFYRVIRLFVAGLVWPAPNDILLIVVHFGLKLIYSFWYILMGKNYSAGIYVCPNLHCFVILVKCFILLILDRYFTISVFSAMFLSFWIYWRES